MKFKVFRFRKIKSTNNTAIRLIKKTNFKNGMVTTNQQTNGKGQYGRKWISFKGNLFVSFFFKLDNLTISIKKLTKINCFLVKKLLSIYYRNKITFKKPNDLLIDKKKICGILQETVSKLDEKYLVVGIGINLKKNPKLINYPTTNLKELIGQNLLKKKIEIQLKNIFERGLKDIYKKKN